MTISTAGNGWEQLSKQRLVETPAVYALSRHEFPTSPMQSKCANGYRGSHDAFVFISPLPQVAVEQMRINPTMISQEGTMIRILQLAELPVINPCHVVKIFHHHNSMVRPNRTHDAPVSWAGSWGFAPPTSSFDVGGDVGFVFVQSAGTKVLGTRQASSKYRLQNGNQSSSQSAQCDQCELNSGQEYFLIDSDGAQMPRFPTGHSRGTRGYRIFIVHTRPNYSPRVACACMCNSIAEGIGCGKSRPIYVVPD